MPPGIRSLTIKNTPPKQNPEEIREFETLKGLEFPEEFVELISKYGGARIEENSYNAEFFINAVLSLNSNRNASIVKIFETYEDEFNTKSWLPFAIDSGGWVFILSLHEETYGQVFIDRFDGGNPQIPTSIIEAEKMYLNTEQIQAEMKKFIHAVLREQKAVNKAKRWKWLFG